MTKAWPAVLKGCWTACAAVAAGISILVAMRFSLRSRLREGVQFSRLRIYAIHGRLEVDSARESGDTCGEVGDGLRLGVQGGVQFCDTSHDECSKEGEEEDDDKGGCGDDRFSAHE